MTDLRRAGLLHDIGRAGIPTGVWEKPGPLSVAEWEQVRLHAYHSERILARAPALAAARGDGRHAPRAHRRKRLSPRRRRVDARRPPRGSWRPPTRYHAMTEPRPYRPALTAAAAAATLAGMPLDRDAVAAVIEAAGAPAPAPRAWPGALTDREVEVLRLLAAGRSKREIAARLVLSPSTVHTHTVHIYAEGRRLDARGARDVGDGARPGDPGRTESTERSMRRLRPPPYGGGVNHPLRRSPP